MKRGMAGDEREEKETFTVGCSGEYSMIIMLELTCNQAWFGKGDQIYWVLSANLHPSNYVYQSMFYLSSVAERGFHLSFRVQCVMSLPYTRWRTVTHGSGCSLNTRRRSSEHGVLISSGDAGGVQE